MEQVGSCAALEQEVMRFDRIIRSLLAGGALMLPLLAYGHGSELTQVRLLVDEAGAINLEMTADYGDNPMLNGKDDANRVLHDLVRIEAGGQEHKLVDLAPLQFEERDQLDPTSPMPLPPDATATSHQLLTAIWRWLPNAGTLRFTVPKGSMHDVLFWKQEPGTEPKWCVLLNGDFTPAITIPQKSHLPSLIGFAVLGVLVLVALGRRAFRQSSAPCPST